MKNKGKEGDLQIWHIPNPPRAAFERSVATVDEAITVLDILADYDNYLGDDYITSNAQGLVVWEKPGEWCDYYDDEGRDIDEIRRDKAGPAPSQ